MLQEYRKGKKIKQLFLRKLSTCALLSELQIQLTRRDYIILINGVF